MKSGDLKKKSKLLFPIKYCDKARDEARVSCEQTAVTARAGALRMRGRMDPPLRGTKRASLSTSDHRRKRKNGHADILTPGCLSCSL